MNSQGGEKINLISSLCKNKLDLLFELFINPILNGQIKVNLNQENDILSDTLERCDYNTYNELKHNIKYTAINDNIVYTCPYISSSKEIIKEIINILNKLTDNNNLSFSNKLLYYKKQGYMGWHTNCDVPGDRWYLIYNTEDKSSFFRYIDPHTGEMITKWEPKGWSINHFIVGDKKSPLWHCIYTNSNRISIGIRKIESLNLFKWKEVIVT